MIVAQPRHNREASFDLTAMIDVVLLLIIFFSLTSQFTESQRRPVDLPRERGDAPTAEASATMVIDLDVDGRVTLLGEEFDAAELRDRLSLKGGGSSGSAGTAKTEVIDVVVRADRRCRSSHLDTVVKALSASGIHRWKLATAGSG